MAEVLSKDEIEQLLAAVNAGDAEPDDFRPPENARKITIYDFKHPDRFTRKRKHSLLMLHEEAARLWTSFFSRRLQADIHVNVASVDQLTYEEFIRSIPSPASCLIVRVTYNTVPFPVAAVIEIDPSLSDEILYFLFQGDRNSIEKNKAEIHTRRELSLLERSALGFWGKILLEYYTGAWSRRFGIPVDFCCESIASHPKQIDIINPDEMVTLITWEVKTPYTNGMIHICLPYPLLEPLLPFLEPEWFFGPQSHNPLGQNKSADYLKNNLSLIVRAEYFRQMVYFRDLSAMKAGDILYPRQPCEKNRCKVMIDNEVFFAGEIITDYTRPQHTHRIKISEIFNPYKEFDTMTDRDFSKTDVSLDQLKVQVIVELGRTVTDLRKIACAEKGAIFELDKFDGESVDVFANNVLFAKGEVVVIDENFGIRLTEILSHSLPEAETGSLLSPAHKLSKEAVFWEIGGQDEKNEAGENSAGI